MSTLGDFSTTLPASNRKLDDDPNNNGLIINTLINLKNNGKEQTTIKSVGQVLRQLSKSVNLADITKVKTYIANAKMQNGKPYLNSSRNKFVFAYDCLCKANGLQWEKPYYKYEPKTPLIPTTENAYKIINSATRRYATIFSIMAETGIEGAELHGITRKDIDAEQGIISVQGHKGHESGTYKLKQSTAEMLREYLHKNPEEQPFPKPKIIGQVWTETRRRIADRLKEPKLKEITLKSLRNYSGATLYKNLPVRDPIAVMRHLRHRKLETTMHYIRAIILDYEEDDQWIVRLSKTIEEDAKLIENGFQYITERDGTKLYKKRK